MRFGDVSITMFEAGVRDLLQKQTRSTLVKHDATKSLIERSEKRRRQDRRALARVDEQSLDDDPSSPMKRPRRKVTFTTWLDEAYAVRSIQGHKLDQVRLPGCAR